MPYTYFGWGVTISPFHGLGILFAPDSDNKYQKCFYEDGTLETDGPFVDCCSAVIELQNNTNVYESRWFRPHRTFIDTVDRLVRNASCIFSMTSDAGIRVDLTSGSQKFTLTVSHSPRYSYFDTTCSCGKDDCVHEAAAGRILKKALSDLQHAYVMTQQPVDKSIFVDPSLNAMVLNLDCLKPGFMPEIRKIMDHLAAVNSPDYYKAFHEMLLDLSLQQNYNSHMLDAYDTPLLLALFDTPGYQAALLPSGHFEEMDSEDDRQRKANIASMKRILKYYQKTVKALDAGNYEENPDLLFLLKYRSDLEGLLRYYADPKPGIDSDDLPYLEQIAALPELDSQLIRRVAEKLDRFKKTSAATPVLRKMLAKLPQAEKVEVYSRLRNISMPVAEIQKLGHEQQLKLIRNTPLTLESFSYIMDELLKDSGPDVRSQYLLFVIEHIRLSHDAGLKKAVIRQISLLPDNRLLYVYALYRFSFSGSYSLKKGDPEKELSTCFSCRYNIVRDTNSMQIQFNISDPESRCILLQVRESGGQLSLADSFFNRLEYDAALIRKVCLKGHEEEYRAAVEENQEALEASLFIQQNQKFASEYQKLCKTLADTKILYTVNEKADIEWQITREENLNYLSFRIGHSKMYIVRDAQEFLQAFRTGATKGYGKDLVLTHDPENLQDADASIIKMLMTAQYKGVYNNRRAISISDALLSTLLEALAGRTIVYNEQPCTIRLDERRIRGTIHSDYTLSTDMTENDLDFLNLDGKGYVVTRQAGDRVIIDRVIGSSEEISLISLIQKNPGVCIKPILKDFRKNVYSRLFDVFDVDKAVEHDFTLSQIRLNTYFDFDKGVITARTAVLRDGKEIRPDALTDRIDLAKTELLSTYLQNLGFEDGKLEDESRVLAFFKMDFTRLKTLTNVYLSENLQNKELKSIGKPVIRVTYQNNLVQVFLEKSDFSESELEQIISGLRKKRKYILLSGERIVDLDSEAAKDFGETVKDFEMDPKDLYQKKTVSMINAIKAFSHERSCRVDQYLRDMIDEIRSFKEADITPPRLNAELRDYQVEGFKWLSILTKYGMGGILADDMGLGKTIQMIALIKSDPTRKPSLVVCPKSLVFNWISEFARFDGETAVTAIYGLDSRRTEIISSIREDEKAVYITSYDSLRNDISKYTCEFNYVVLDEAQYIKNVNALKTRSVKELKACHRFAMTGTPIENSVIDLWSIFDFIMPGYFEELSRFRDADTAIIARKAAPFILRRVKEDVLEDLPPKYERILSADMSARQRKVYDAMRMDARKALEAGGKAFDMLPYLTRLRQVCVDPGMFVEGYQGGSGKLDMLSTLIPQYLAADHRILIFSQFVKALESVERMLQEKGIPTYFLSGATPAKDRVEMMDSFNNGSGTNVFLISLKAGGTGLNLTGADTVIHLDPWWNVAAENQASDRTHRIGQVRNVEVIKLIASDSIEQRVVELQDLKKEVIRQVISDDDGSVTSASLEDIAFVLD